MITFSVKYHGWKVSCEIRIYSIYIISYLYECVWHVIFRGVRDMYVLCLCMEYRLVRRLFGFYVSVFVYIKMNMAQRNAEPMMCMGF